MGLRLFPDSVNAVFTEAAGFTNYTPYTDKQQLFLKGQVGDGLPEPRRLDAIFLLNDPKEKPGEEICIAPVSGSESMLAMIYSAFSLDPSDKKMMASNFRNVGQAVSERLDVLSLSYQRKHDCLPEVRQAVIDRLA